MSDGKIRMMMPDYMGECFTCDYLDVIPAYKYKKAEKLFRGVGWRKRQEKWLCPKCAKKGYGLKNNRQI